MQFVSKVAQPKGTVKGRAPLAVFYFWEMSHRVYIDSLPGIVETPEMACGLCQSYLSDDMAVSVLSKEIGVASRRTIIRHVAQIQTHKEPAIHFVTCYHELRKRGLECCFASGGNRGDGTSISLKERVEGDRAADRLNRSGDDLNWCHKFLQDLRADLQKRETLGGE